ncbi:tRNA (5-methylaminomethyl-2-thiouridine)(34)-methyltransferase MnmD [Calothrix sp. UHCC 0171]|uniref:tRNA (5-methylaminomethyl-2-thiouridine)(34)-methyltransferase MnmD n=1 Tax=Calothrix sp. UHCC 0171 TaxID=3110245 RepID=UPI002B213013|nr:MnmC family methyltransferase [Calothrix sp. UHCC 0171]MEA5572255.1 MnmC family methyltransferase [Calothrix sp. UHCC 0171]
MSNQETFIPQPTADGSFTFFSEEFGELFHSHYGAYQESIHKFVVPTQLEIQAQKPVIRILDICYGLGYNTAAAIQTIWSINPDCHIEIIALEMNSAVPKAAITHQLFNHWNCENIDILDILIRIAENHYLEAKNVKANLLLGDARITIQQLLASGFQADAIFLDPFSPPQCPQLWTIEFMQLVSQCLSLTGRLATYSCAASVRTALLTSGLEIGSTPPVGRKAPGTIAIHPQAEETILPPLSTSELEHLQTRAAIPYRDFQLCDSAAVILERRKQEQQRSSLEPTSHWRKRWHRTHKHN